MIPLQQLDDCDRCSARTKASGVVWGRYPGRTVDVAFVGDHPNSEDDLVSEPFAGREGDLLRKLIAESSLDPRACLYTHSVKCFPGKGRLPTKAAEAACQCLLERDLDAADPVVTVCLGPGAVGRLLDPAPKVGFENKVWHFRERKPGRWVVGWYSPTTILRGGKKMDFLTVALLKTVSRKVSDVRMAQAQGW